jgi:hypothetical protein
MMKLARDRAVMKNCNVCGLCYQASLSHGMVDCAAGLRYQIDQLQRDLINVRSRARIAEETLHEVESAIKGWKGKHD